MEVHKVVLISSSPFFRNLLKRNKHPHPLVFMRGFKYENLLSMVDSFYRGEANVYQENLDTFLTMADEFQLKGFKKRHEEEEIESVSRNVSSRQRFQSSNTKHNPFAMPKDQTTSRGLENKVEMTPSSETALALNNSSSYLEELDLKVKSMMTLSQNQTKSQGKARICNVCGKEGQTVNIKHHIEANHMTNISIPCNACGKISSSRNALNSHKRICKCQPGFLSQ